MNKELAGKQKAAAFRVTDSFVPWKQWVTPQKAKKKKNHTKYSNLPTDYVLDHLSSKIFGCFSQMELPPCIYPHLADLRLLNF